MIKSYTGWSKKSLWIDIEEKCLGNSRSFCDRVFISYVEKSYGAGSKNPENGLFKKSHSIKKETYLICSFSISIAR